MSQTFPQTPNTEYSHSEFLEPKTPTLLSRPTPLQEKADPMSLGTAPGLVAPGAELAAQLQTDERYKQEMEWEKKAGEWLEHEIDLAKHGELPEQKEKAAMEAKYKAEMEWEKKAGDWLEHEIDLAKKGELPEQKQAKANAELKASGAVKSAEALAKLEDKFAHSGADVQSI